MHVRYIYEIPLPPQMSNNNNDTTASPMEEESQTSAQTTQNENAPDTKAGFTSTLV